MDAKLIERVPLANGLTLELLDQSRRMAGDRWLVSLLAKVEILVLPEYFSELEESEQAYQNFVMAYGTVISFSQEKVRRFVDEKDKEDELSRLCQIFKENLLSYLAKPRFAALYSLKKYGDLQDRQKWTAGAPDI